MPEISGIIQNYLRGSIESIGGEPPVIESKTITENGTYTAPEGVDGFSPVVVNVPTVEPVIDSISIFENGTYTAPEGIDGYSPIIVDIPPKVEVTLNATSNGTYTPEEGYVYNGAIVNVPQNCNMYSSNDDKLRLYENVFNSVDILSFNGLYINQTKAFSEIDNEYIRNKLSNLGYNPLGRVYNSSSSSSYTNEIGVDSSASLIRLYANNLSTYDTNYAYGSIILIDLDLIAGQYPIQKCPNIQ